MESTARITTRGPCSNFRKKGKKGSSRKPLQTQVTCTFLHLFPVDNPCRPPAHVLLPAQLSRSRLTFDRTKVDHISVTYRAIRLIYMSCFFTFLTQHGSVSEAGGAVPTPLRTGWCHGHVAHQRKCGVRRRSRVSECVLEECSAWCVACVTVHKLATKYASCA
jgi:hypothetical protein